MNHLTSEKKISFKIRIASLFGALILLIADQFIKFFVDLKLKGNSPLVLIKNVIQLSYVENDGAMMGFMSGKTGIMTVLAVLCVVVLLAVVLSGVIKDTVDYLCVLLMISGGLGNIIDRIFRGYVIDYIEVLFVDFYVFNFADCLITVAAFVMIFYQLYLIYADNKEKKKTGEKQ